MQIVNVNVSELKPNKDNPRFLREKNFLKLCESLRSYPALLNLNPIKAHPDGTIIAGNQRYRAALEIGMQTIPVIYSELSDNENEVFSLLDNAHFGEWDTDALSTRYEADFLAAFEIVLFEMEEPKEREIQLKEEREVCKCCGK